MANQLIVKPAPHQLDSATTRSIMTQVLVALVPALAAACFIFGFGALLITAFSVLSCLALEFIFFKLTGRENNLSDLSAVVTGVLIAFCVPVDLPLYVLFFGDFVAIVIVKQMFGGIGKNFANPAITARIAMMVSFALPMSTWPKPANAFFVLDAVTEATPLALLREDAWELPSYLTLLLGNHAGSLGETCGIALLLGGIFLVARKIISPVGPLSFAATMAVVSLIAGQDPLYAILSGGFLLGAIYMATDYATSPSTPKGQIIFGVGCGLITMMIRLFGAIPEGVSYGILLMNILTPHIDRVTRRKPLGGVHREVA